MEILIFSLAMTGVGAMLLYRDQHSIIGALLLAVGIGFACSID